MIVDTQENEFQPIEIDPSEPVRLRADRPRARTRSLPDSQSPAGEGAIQGSLLLFKLTNEALQNRPLEFKIQSPENTEEVGDRRPRRLAAASPRPGRPCLRRRRGGLAARALADEQHRDGDLRVAVGREADEPRVGVGLVLLRLRGRAAPGSAGAGSSLTVLRSSAVPVLPATLTPGTAAPMPVPDVTTARMKRAITRAVRSLVARVCWPWAPRESTGATRRPRSPIVAATVASSSGVASTTPWPIADEPTARSSPISSAARDRRAGGAERAGRPG